MALRGHADAVGEIDRNAETTGIAEGFPGLPSIQEPANGDWQGVFRDSSCMLE